MPIGGYTDGLKGGWTDEQTDKEINELEKLGASTSSPP